MTTQRAQLQRLWDLADATLGASDPPSQQQLDALRRAMALIPLNELGISEPTSESNVNRNSKQITYLHIYEDENFSLGVFCLPAGAQIPLHNHPGMTVLSQVLYGTMHVTSYDWNSPQDPEQGVRLVHDRDFSPQDGATTLFPTAGGNIHQFTAVTDCAVLDLLSPPYATDEGRDCTYYRPVQKQQQQDSSNNFIVVLEEYEPPEDFQIVSEEYKGIRVNLKNKGHKQQQQQQQPAEDIISWGSGASSGSPRSVTPTQDGGAVCLEEESTAAALTNKLKMSHLSSPPVNASERV